MIVEELDQPALCVLTKSFLKKKFYLIFFFIYNKHRLVPSYRLQLSSLKKEKCNLVLNIDKARADHTCQFASSLPLTPL